MSVDHDDIDKSEHSPEEVALTAEIAAAEGEWDRLEQAGLALTCLARQRRNAESRGGGE